MTIYEANRLLNSDKANRSELSQCLEDLCKEYGYVERMIVANSRDLVSGKNTLAEMQLLIEQLKEKLK